MLWSVVLESNSNMLLSGDEVAKLKVKDWRVWYQGYELAVVYNGTFYTNH